MAVSKFIFLRQCICVILLAPFICIAQESVSNTETPIVSKELNTAQTAADDVEEILVTGEQPGPNLLKIYKGDHVLYILPIISPLPKNMQWHSKKVEESLASAQEFIYPWSVHFKIGFWTEVSLLPSIIGIKNNPEGKRLEQVLPPESYARWLQLKSKYMKDEKKIEKMRPIFAAEELFKQSIDQSGLVPADNIRWALEAIVKKNKIKITHPDIQRTLEHARTTVNNFKKSSLDDVACFNATLQRLETDLDAMKVRANAWAVGDLDKLKQLPYQDEKESCMAAVLDSQLGAENGLPELMKLANEEWVRAAEAALTNNEVSFAFINFNDLTKDKSLVAQLIARGYTAEY